MANAVSVRSNAPLSRKHSPLFRVRTFKQFDEQAPGNVAFGADRKNGQKRFWARRCGPACLRRHDSSQTASDGAPEGRSYPALGTQYSMLQRVHL